MILVVIGGMLVLGSTAIRAQPPDTLWTATFGGNSDDYGQSVQQTSDGGYILGGYTNSFGAGNWDMYLVKTDSLGIMEWDTTFGGSSIDRCHSVQQTSDGGYILGGYTMSFGNDMYLVKTDSQGHLEWQQTFGGNQTDHCRSVQQTSDGGYILGGYTLSFGAGVYDMYLVKTDPTGNLEWQQSFGGYSNDYGRSVQQTSDGGYILGGYTGSFIAVPSGRPVMEATFWEDIPCPSALVILICTW